jgi:hypothetical protein
MMPSLSVKYQPSPCGGHVTTRIQRENWIEETKNAIAKRDYCWKNKWHRLFTRQLSSEEWTASRQHYSCSSLASKPNPFGYFLPFQIRDWGDTTDWYSVLAKVTYASSTHIATLHLEWSMMMPSWSVNISHLHEANTSPPGFNIEGENSREHTAYAELLCSL